MTEQEVKELRDIQGFIEFCIKNDERQAFCLSNVGHDCGVLLHPGGGSLRTTDYAKHYLRHFNEKGR